MSNYPTAYPDRGEPAMTTTEPIRCAHCPGRLIKVELRNDPFHDAGTYTTEAGTWTHIGRGDEPAHWCDTPEPA